MSTKQHLKELQIRFFIVAIFFIIGACLAYAFQDQLIPFLLAPIGEEKLVYLNPGGGFNFIFLVSIYAGIALAFPIIIQQLYGFLRPALPATAQKRSSFIIIGSMILLTAGIVFGYYVAVPSAINFLYGFADKYVEASLTADSYLNFVIAYTIGIGLVFQIPLILLLIHAVKPLTPGGLLRSERWVILTAFIVAAIITPTPDPVNQGIIAGPVIIVYQIGVGIILWSILRQRRADKKKIAQALRKARALKKKAAEASAHQPHTPALRPLASNKQHEQPVPRRQLTMDGIARLQTAYEFPNNHPVAHASKLNTTQKTRPVQQVSKKPITQPVAHAVTAAPSAQPSRSMDGFKLSARGKIQPTPRPNNQIAERRSTPHFSIDGISSRRATSY